MPNATAHTYKYERRERRRLGVNDVAVVVVVPRTNFDCARGTFEPFGVRGLKRVYVHPFSLTADGGTQDLCILKSTPNYPNSKATTFVDLVWLEAWPGLIWPGRALDANVHKRGARVSSRLVCV